MWITLFLFVVGFILLIKGADFLVDGASSLAQRLGVSSLLIGLTVVAFGTSAPELVVNLIAGLQNNTELAVGNILGSNISNTLLILGVASLIYPITVRENTVWKELPFSLLSVVVLFLMANDAILDGTEYSEISRSDGLIMFAFFILFLGYLFSMAKSGLNIDPSTKHKHVHKEPLWLASTMVLAGLVGLILGGKWIVDGAVTLGMTFGLSEAFMGLTVLALGTSLPELTTAIVAALKKESDLIVGGVIGSNIFNILLVLATTASLSPLKFTPALNEDITMVLLTTFLLLIFLLRGNSKKTILRWEGATFVIIYAVYLGYLVIRG